MTREIKVGVRLTADGKGFVGEFRVGERALRKFAAGTRSAARSARRRPAPPGRWSMWSDANNGCKGQVWRGNSRPWLPSGRISYTFASEQIEAAPAPAPTRGVLVVHPMLFSFMIGAAAE